MVSLAELNIKSAFSSDADDILNEFYVKALGHSVVYKRAAGFFSSTSLAVAARGIWGLIQNGGRMKLVVSPNLSKKDVDVINKSTSSPEAYISKFLCNSLSEVPSGFVSDHVSALGWMIANGLLVIKIAIVTDEYGDAIPVQEQNGSSLFHPKVGILEDDEGNSLSFSGSLNESASGWLSNIEEFKVFRSWNEGENKYVAADSASFEKFWSDNAQRTKVIPLPDAVEKKLVAYSNESFDLSRIKGKYLKLPPDLLDHQNAAITAWINAKRQGIFEMATGTGKTYAAIGCVENAFSEEEKLIVVVASPFSHLIPQWKNSFKKFHFNDLFEMTADSTENNWRNVLSDLISEMKIGTLNRLCIYTTHKTASSNDFLLILEEIAGSAKIFLIVDEVHGIGSPKQNQALAPFYDLRLGLSATPKRWFDDEGTTLIYDYFGDIVYKFEIREGLETVNPHTDLPLLAQYEYFPYFASLDDDELRNYIELTIKIVKRSSVVGKITDQKDAALDSLVFKRAEIIKAAKSKYGVLEAVLDDVSNNLTQTIIYCNHVQFEEVSRILTRRNINFHKFTMEEGVSASPLYNGLSERESILDEFKRGSFQVLLAMRCLDEGVDIPSATRAILLSSSSNPREYVQRIGRIIRQGSKKKIAEIIDILVFPEARKLPDETREYEIRVLGKELSRFYEIVKNAKNNNAVLRSLSFEFEKRGY